MAQDGADRRRRHKRDVDQRHKRGRHPGPIDNGQTREQRRELAAFVRTILNKPRRKAALHELGNHRVRLMPHHDHHIVHTRVEKGRDDARQERVPCAKRQVRLEPTHASRLARREDDHGDHEIAGLQDCRIAERKGEMAERQKGGDGAKAVESLA